MAVAALDSEQLDQKQVLRALGSLKRGDFSVRLPDTWTGTAGKIADTFNEIVEVNQGLASELSRIRRVIGQQGRLTQRADYPGVTGSWEAMITSINALIEDLVRPTIEVSRVIGAVAKGDLSETMELEVEGHRLEGEFLRTAKTANTMVSQLSNFASEVTRVAREVGIEGKLGGQARVKGVSGTWKDLTDNVNQMAANLTSQVRSVAQVTTAVARGDLSKKINVDVRGEFQELKDTINTMVDQLGSFASEVTRVAREVGMDGRLGGQADVKGVSGTWKDLTDSVNMMANNLTGQVRNIAAVTTAVANGDLSKKITVDVKGEILALKATINTMVDQLSSFASEVTRVAREVGTEGKLGGQADVKGVSGTWKDLTDSVNMMAGNLTGQVRNIAEVTTAVANGDLSKKIAVDVKGEILELKNTINTMVDQLRSFASEVTRVAREVGTEGKLGGQADVQGVSGTWKDLTDNVNLLAANLTGQVRNIADVTTAVARGDLSKKITVDVKGEILELKNTINVMVDQLRSFASEVTRVAREVGMDGKLGGQADVKGVSGTWKDLTDNVNLLAANLTGQVRNIADVTTAVARGDLSKKITVDVKGEILELKDTINTMVDQLSTFASEVTRVAREVGTEGKLGGQAEVKGVAGTWKDLTDSVNMMGGNLTDQVRNIAEVTTAVANGDLSKKITVDVKGEILELKDTINTMVDQLRSFASEVTRVAREVGTEGRLGGQAYVSGVAGTWKDLTDNVNMMAANLTGQVRNIADVTTAVATGDLSRKITVDVKGEILELKNTINTMVDQLSSFASEVTRVAREVGTEGKLGGQAEVRGVAGTWKDLTDSVNMMGGNLTEQVRGIARVVTAVANGDLNQKLVLAAKGEIAALVETINFMIVTLATFADQVTTVAREVGVEGKLGGQANVPGAAGTWRGLTDNVNQLAANLTTQVRAIAEVATAVTEGDLTRSINVMAEGEVAVLKDNINQMILNLRETTSKNTEQDWLKTNLAKFTRMLQGQRDLLEVGRQILSELAPVVSAHQGVFYIVDTAIGESGAIEPILKLLASYAYRERKSIGNRFRMGEGLVGQTALEKERILLTNVPMEYIQIGSGLGEVRPRNIVVLPVLFEGQVKAVIELASLEQFSDTHLAFLDQLTDSIGVVINTIEANMRTEELLKQSQNLAQELQSRQLELQHSNEELEDKASLLAEQNAEVERKNREVELAKRALEEKAGQLALTSKYKSEFLANMSHELRTPLNSLLILARQLSDNPDGNLSGRQVEFAQTIHGAGSDLLSLINDILDLSKIESGTVTLDIAEIQFHELVEYVQRTFRHMAESKGLGFEISLEHALPRSIRTDVKRLQQVLKNLLANAFKFTEQGGVSLKVSNAYESWIEEHPILSRADRVVSFLVQDTGIGISDDKQQIIFEAFQQAEGSTNRKFGGTGLGLSISREIASLLGGELRLTASTVGEGSAFVLYLPIDYLPAGDRTTPLDMRPRLSNRLAADISGTVAYVPEIVRLSSDDDHGNGNGDILAVDEDSPADDRSSIGPGDRVLEIVEDDRSFSRVLTDLARDNGFKVLLAGSGRDALYLAHEYNPSAISLDMNLPDIDGWTVLRKLKENPHTRHIPVQVVTVTDQRQRGLSRGALGFLVKPVTREQLDSAFSQVKSFIDRPVRRLLVVEDDRDEQREITRLAEGPEVEIVSVDRAEKALKLLKSTPADCVIVDLRLPGKMQGLDLIEAMQQDPTLADIPVIIHSAKELNNDELSRINGTPHAVIFKDVRSRERLADETSIFLHRHAKRGSGLSDPGFRELTEEEAPLAGKKVLVVDDDMRNQLALCAILERQNMKVITADNGLDALQKLEAEHPFDIVLMDIMMPVQDGYETIQAVRAIAKFERLPIIAVTAKAMKGDREKCLKAGASDYLKKPIETNKLFSIMRAWIHKQLV